MTSTMSSPAHLALNSYYRTIEVEPDYDFAYFCRAATYAHLGEDVLTRAEFQKVLVSATMRS